MLGLILLVLLLLFLFGGFYLSPLVWILIIVLAFFAFSRRDRLF